MLEKIKLALRIKHSAVDEDLKEVIEACKMDMKRVGIVKFDESDFFMIQLVKLYAKWQMNYEEEAERYMKAYEMMRDSLSLSGDYNV